MIILLSGDISLNPGPNQNTGSIKDLQDLRHGRGLKVLHQNICGLSAHTVSLEELLSRQGCEQAQIIGISETHLINIFLMVKLKWKVLIRKGKIAPVVKEEESLFMSQRH